MPHALVVGGTGMLRDVPLYFAKYGFTVSVIARNQNNLNKLIESKSVHGFINPLRVDYSDYYLLEEKLKSAIDNYGKIETAVCWIHSIASEAPYKIAGILNGQNIKVKFYHVLGSANIPPDGRNQKFESDISGYENIIYRKIMLGFVIEDDKSRWLTDTEISNGVIDAVIKEDNNFVVGRIEPREKLP